jgi:hypothetical protein
MEVNLASSNVREDVVIFSSQRLNAWNATIGRGTTIVIGASREILQDILEYRLALARQPSAAASNDSVAKTSTNQEHSTSSTPATTVDYELIVEDGSDIVELTRVFCPARLMSYLANSNSGLYYQYGNWRYSISAFPRDSHVHYGLEGTKALRFSQETPEHFPLELMPFCGLKILGRKG